MSGILNVGIRALQANQIALQTAGNNIANVNTPGYSRQTVVLQTAAGQFTGGGYIGKGVDVETIQRNYSEFLTRQSALAGATAAADSTIADQLKQLENIFASGSTGLGASVSDMLNAFSDVASAPTDLTARTVALTRVDETAARMRSASQSLDDLQLSVSQTLSQKVSAVNSLAQNIADVNQQIARAQGSGQAPNDLLDQRDQFVRELNQYVQTTSIPATDGTVSIFLAGSQALVMGNTVSPVSIVKDDFADPLKSKLAISRGGQSITLDENTLGGGEISGLLRFQNNDLNQGRNLLGRLTLAVSTAMNDQHKLGLDLNGKVGGDLFTLADISANVLAPKAPATLNSLAAGNLTLAVADPTKFVASDYEMDFTTATTGNITRRSDGVSTAFTFKPATTAPTTSDGTFAFQNPTNGNYDVPAIDGLVLGAVTTSAPNAGDRFLLKPFSTAASTISSAFSTPSALAVASPIVASASSANTGTLAVTSLAAQTVASSGGDNYSINFHVVAGVTTYDIVDTTKPTTTPTAQPFVAGQAITYAPATVPATPGWSLTLSGAAADGDTFTIQPQPAAYRNLNVGNANAMLGLRGVAMFDGAALTDGYASLISQIGVRAQSANNAATVSSSIASTLETERTSVSGVNLDEEAAKLLQFQQAYQASAKLIQASQNIFDTLLKSLP